MLAMVLRLNEMKMRILLNLFLGSPAAICFGRAKNAMIEIPRTQGLLPVWYRLSPVAT